MGVTRSLRRRLLRSSAAAVLLLLAVWAGWTAQHRFGDPPAAVPVIARAGAPGPGLVSVLPSAFYGIRAATAAQRLQASGLRTQVRSVTAPGQPSGTVIGITPAGDVSPGTMITFYVAIALPAGPGHPLATTHQRLPGRHPLSARVMMFAVSGCFRRGMAGVSWSVTSQTARCRDAAGPAIPGRLPAAWRVTPATCSPAGHIGGPYVV
jgi:PASTA domain